VRPERQPQGAPREQALQVIVVQGDVGEAAQLPPSSAAIGRPSFRSSRLR
jgi:hypothetical protein